MLASLFLVAVYAVAQAPDPLDPAGVEPPGDPPPAPFTPAPDEPVPSRSRPEEVSLAGSAAVGAFGAALGAGIGTAPALFVLIAAPLDAEPVIALLALAALPSVAALGAGMLAVLLVVDDPGMGDIGDVLFCSAMSCIGPVLVAALVGAGGGGGGCGTGTSCGSCGSGGDGNDFLESPALAHATGAAIGGFVGASLGTALIAIELDASPRVRQEGVALGIVVGAGAGVLGAIAGGAIGGLVGADAEEERRSARLYGSAPVTP